MLSSKSRVISCFAMSSSFVCRFEYLFNFDSMFEIHDDIEVLKRMGMACGLEVGKCSAEDLKVARSLVPKALEPYVIGRCPHVLSCFLLVEGSVITRGTFILVC